MGIAERKQLEKNARKKLIWIAHQLFFIKRLCDATIEDIAARAEISKGTIYLYFKSKADLYFSITRPALENLSKRLKRITKKESDAPEVRIRSLCMPSMLSILTTGMLTILSLGTKQTSINIYFQRNGLRFSGG